MEQVQETKKTKRVAIDYPEKPKVSLVYSKRGEVTEEDSEPLPFDTAKVCRVARTLLKNRIAPEDALEQPEEISRTALERVHDPDYLATLRHPLALFSAMHPFLPATPGEVAILKLPSFLHQWRILHPLLRPWVWLVNKHAAIFPNKIYTPQFVDEMIREAETDAGGTLLAARRAMETGIDIHIGGGATFAEQASCSAGHLFADIPVAIRALQAEKRIKRALVADLCAHFGDGTANCLTDDDSAFTFSMHQKGLWPDLPDNSHSSDLHVELEEGTSDQEYMEILEKHLPKLLDEHRPDLVFLVTSDSCLSGDEHANLSLSTEGLVRRDAYVAKACVERKIPLAITISGGMLGKSADEGAYASVRNLIETYGGAWETSEV